MNARKSIYAIFILLIFCFLQFFCGERPAENPNILSGSLNFFPPKGAEVQFNALLQNPQHKSVFKKGQINIYVRDRIWQGRIKVNDASFQSLFTFNKFRTEWEGEPSGARNLRFSIYNPEGSDLTYKVSLFQGGEQHRLYEKRIFEKKLIDVAIPLKQELKGKVKLCFETTGSGPGAWISPRWDIQEENPGFIIYIVLDTLRYDHSSAYGYLRETTPNLKLLRKDGVQYTNAYTTSSWTLPAHVSLFSGKNLSDHGVLGPEFSIPDNIPLLAEVLQDRGYMTAAFTGGGFIEDSYGFHRGFQYYSNQPGNVFSIKSAERVFAHFKNYAERYQGNDRFIFLHTYQIHAPYKAPGDYIRRINSDLKKNLLGISNFITDKRSFYKALAGADRQALIDLYDASILYTDEVLIGGVIRYLKTRGIYDQSMIVILSDHGEEFYDHGSWEHGHTLYNELVKIPLVIKYPAGGSVRPKINNSLISISDIPGLTLKTFGLHEPVKKEFKSSRENEYLTILFPISPTVKEFPTKISFVDQNYSFIFNQVNPKFSKFFNPPPLNKNVSYELYKRTDMDQVHNIADQNAKVMEVYRKRIRDYLNKLKKFRDRKGKLDSGLKDKLKSLGYLD